MTMRPTPATLRPATRQQGAMLMIALIVLVAMTLAGLAMMRSVDTGSIVAGNLAFKESTVHAADGGIQQGYAYLAANSGTAVLNNDNFAVGVSSQGFFSSAPASEPDWTTTAPWTNAGVVNAGNPDASGNVVYYVIHRLCSVPNCARDATCTGQVNICGTTPDNTAINSEGVDASSPNFFTRPPTTHYRVTAKAVGPRNSITIVQSLMRTQ